MAQIKDFFNHRAKVAKRNKALKALDDANEALARDTEKSLHGLLALEKKIAEIRALFPDKTDGEAVEAYYEQLKQRNARLEDENVKLVLEINSHRKELEELKASLTQFRNSLVRPEDVAIAFYDVGDGVLTVNAFLYVDETTVYDADLGRNVGVKYYRSLGGERSICINLELGSFVSEGASVNGCTVNTEPLGICRFEDWCIKSGQSLHLNSMVSIDQINASLELFRNSYNFAIDNGEVSATRKRVISESQMHF